MPREFFKKQSVGQKIVGKNKGIHIPIYVHVCQRAGSSVDRATALSSRNQGSRPPKAQFCEKSAPPTFLLRPAPPPGSLFFSAPRPRRPSAPANPDHDICTACAVALDPFPLVGVQRYIVTTISQDRFAPFRPFCTFSCTR
jgi:hypothetical protein